MAAIIAMALLLDVAAVACCRDRAARTLLAMHGEERAWIRQVLAEP